MGPTPKVEETKNSQSKLEEKGKIEKRKEKKRERRKRMQRIYKVIEREEKKKKEKEKTEKHVQTAQLVHATQFQIWVTAKFFLLSS